MSYGGGGRGGGRGGGGGGGYQRQQQNYRQQPNLNARDDPESMALFNKVYTFNPSAPVDPTISVFATPPFRVDALDVAKARLNTTKSKLDEKDMAAWGPHTTLTLRTGDVVKKLRGDAFDVEMATVAWAKMYELLYDYDLIKPKDSQRVTTVHLCEAPGAFICATHHYVCSEIKGSQGQPTDWSWFGVSLNPYHEGNNGSAMVDDDAFIAATYNNWEFGADNTGNIMIQDNIRAYWARACSNGGRAVDLVTADGSVDAQFEPNEQEAITAALHYAEFVCALGLLSTGGNAVLKMFTYFEHSSVCIVYLASTLFESTRVVKPATSKSGNSETYLVCKRFKGINPVFLETLLAAVGPNVFDDHAMLPLDVIPAAFMKEMVVCAAQFEGYQRNTIEENIELFENMPRDKKSRIWQQKQAIATYWVEHFRIKRLDDRLAPKTSLDGRSNRTGFLKNDRRKDGGSTLKERQGIHMARADVLGLDVLVGTGTSHKNGQDDDEHTNKKPRQDDSTTAGHPENGQSDAQPLMDLSSSSEAESSSSATKMSVSQKIMASMGFQEGGALGKNEQGIKAPIVPVQHLGKQGLRSKSALSEDVFTFRYPLPTTVPVDFSALHPLFAKPLERVIHSKFAPDKLIQDWVAARRAYEQQFGSKAARRSHCAVQGNPCHDKSNGSHRLAKLLSLNESLFNSLVPSSSAWRFIDLDPKSDVGAQFAFKLPSPPIGGYAAVAAREGVVGLDMSRDFVPQIDAKVQIVFGNVGKTRHAFKTELLSELLVALACLVDGGVAVFRFDDLLTRFSSGFVFLCAAAFAEVIVHKPVASCTFSTEVFIVARNFQQSKATSAKAYVEQIVHQASTQGDKLDILECIPLLTIINDPSLFNFLQDVVPTFYEKRVEAFTTATSALAMQL